jgi:hypothetical protein
MSFLVKRIFALMNVDQIRSFKLYNFAKSTYFVRSQDYLKQQSTSAGTRVWFKKKNLKV